MAVRIAEITTAEELLEIVKMIFINTLTAFAHNAEEERQVQSKRARLFVTTKRSRLKTAKPSSAPALKPVTPQQVQTQPSTTKKMNADANSQQASVCPPIITTTTTAAEANVSHQNGGSAGVLPTKTLIY